MDPFKKIFVFSLLVTLVALGFVGYVAMDCITSGNIPDSESGVIVSKGKVMDGRPVNYSVSLDSGKVLYIVNNSTLFDELAVNTSYSFVCRIVFLDGLIVIDSAEVKS